MSRPNSEVIADLSNFGAVSEENYESFETLVQEASENHDQEFLFPLVDCLDDSCEVDEIMFGVVHAIESFPRDDYLTAISERLKQILSNSPRWGSILVTRIMNSEPAFEKFIARLSEQNAITKEEAIKLMRRLSAKQRFHAVETE